MNTLSSPHLHTILSRLNEIGAAINRCEEGDLSNLEDTLRLIVESATKVVPGASAVIYTYDQGRRAFNLGSRLSAGESEDAVPDDQPRPDGIGARAIGQGRRVLSYEESDLDIHPSKVDAGAKAMACLPLVVAAQVVGVLYVYLHQDRRFSRFELLLLDNFCNQAAMAIYQARRQADIQQKLQTFTDLL